MKNPNTSTLAEIDALYQSATQQPRNANGQGHSHNISNFLLILCCTTGGLWYYDNVKSLAAYSNLSYLDGMFSFAPFYTILPSVISSLSAPVAFEEVFQQLDTLYLACFHKETGLLVHGYDGSKTRPWADPVTGASPIVWSRSLGWFVTGLVDTLSAALELYRYPWSEAPPFVLLDAQLNELAAALIQAVETSANATGRYALWQVVTEPGAPDNFVESSGTALVAYVLAKGVKSGLILDPALRECATFTATKMVDDLLQNFVTINDSGTLSFNGTSSVASLSGRQVDYEVSAGKCVFMMYK